MTSLPWLPIATASDDGRAVFVWNGDARWASWRVPVFDPDPEHEGELWCEDRLPMSPPPTHWLPLSPPSDSSDPDEWVVSARRSSEEPDGFVEAHTILMFRPQGSAMLSDAVVKAAARNIVDRLVVEIFPQLLDEIRFAKLACPRDSSSP
jgi:hypothetical protein